MYGARPGTAPCHRRPAPEEWTQVSVLVQDILSSAAAEATPSSGSAPSRRPHTACVCARPVLYPESSSSDDESDGGSLDEERDELELPSRAGTARAADSIRPPTQGYEAQGQPEILVVDDVLDDAPRKSPEPLPRDMELLLGGDVFGQALAASAHRTPMLLPPREVAPKTPNAKACDAAMKAAAEKLPRHCLFGRPAPSAQPSRGIRGRLGGPRVMAPAAARLRSHISWAHHLPIPAAAVAAESADIRLAEAEAAAAASISAGAGYVADSVPVPAASSSTASAGAAESVLLGATAPIVVDAGMPALVGAELEAAANSSTSQAAPALAPAMGEPPKKKRGPKYIVGPGGSRPKSIGAQKVPPSEFMVLEFRTEPRAVPASRAPAKSEARSNPLRFRPKDREWAVQREVLTIK